MDDAKRHWVFLATGWTIAAALFTAWAFWLGDAHSRSFSGFGWLLALYWWCVVLWERHKSQRASRR